MCPRISTFVTICEKLYRLLPAYMDETRSKPEWCPGFEEKVESEKVEVKSETGDTPRETEEQQELPL